MFGISDNNQGSDHLIPPSGDSVVPQPALPVPMTSTVPALRDAMQKADAPQPTGSIQSTDSPSASAYITTEPSKLIKGAVAEGASRTAAGSGSSDNQLTQIRQQALQNLAPMLDHLDQTPEERFRTTLMLIQATDNAELVRVAYEAANQIQDEKKRAQALLDVVNEINYLTHPSGGTAVADKEQN